MQRSLAKLEAVVRDAICRVCTERSVPGPCAVEAAGDCALFHLFPRVVRSILTVHSADINDRVAAIRRDVCSACREQQADGSCQVRRQGACSLDAYLILLVDVLQEAAARRASGWSEPDLHIKDNRV